MQQQERDPKASPQAGKKPYTTPELTHLGKVSEVTRKSGGAQDGGAAMMDKSGAG